MQTPRPGGGGGIPNSVLALLFGEGAVISAVSQPTGPLDLATPPLTITALDLDRETGKQAGLKRRVHGQLPGRETRNAKTTPQLH